ncbi:hypothetical protein BD779DRAFT_1678501 [Infundibulicybe gibba]|nr:hypothetical protein BD779DRAFT_1678501 [Infundibulicybe gibba]
MFSKDMSKFSFHITEWKGHIGDISKRLGVTSGALIRGAYAVATAEGDRSEDTLVFEVADGSNAAGLSLPPWGFCLHVKPTRIRVSPGSTGSESSRLVDAIRQANRGHMKTLPYLGHSWDMTVKILSEQGRFSEGHEERGYGLVLGADTSSPPGPSKGVQSIFDGTLAFETVCDIYVPVYVEIHIWKEKVTFACPFDPDTANRDDIETFAVGRQIEVLESLSTIAF